MTTGSLVNGTAQGLANGLSTKDIGKVTSVNGNPSGLLFSTPTSGVAWDGTNGNHYMSKGAGHWIKLGSVQF